MWASKLQDNPEVPKIPKTGSVHTRDKRALYTVPRDVGWENAPAVYRFYDETRNGSMLKNNRCAVSMATINAIAGINYCGGSLLHIFTAAR